MLWQDANDGKCLKTERGQGRWESVRKTALEEQELKSMKEGVGIWRDRRKDPTSVE